MKVASGALFVRLALALGGASTAGGEDVPVTLPEALALADRANRERRRLTRTCIARANAPVCGVRRARGRLGQRERRGKGEGASRCANGFAVSGAESPPGRGAAPTSSKP